MNRWITFILTLNIVVLCTLLVPTDSLAQDSNNDEIEVYLEFRHRGIIGAVVVSYYKDGQFFLPLSELFSLFKVDHAVNGLIINGRFGLEQIPYQIDLREGIEQIRFGDKALKLTYEDYLIKEIDSYLKADLFYEAFGLDFTIDFNNLTLKLRTEKELPVIAEALRKQRRKLADNNRYQDIRYDLRFDRERPFLDGGFIDYNLSANLSSGSSIYNANTNLGIQLYGGDLQGSIFGSYSDNFSNFATDNLRWRYMYQNQPWLTKITLGQTTSDGVAKNSYTGIRLTNEPIEPRRLFDEFEVQGNTIPQSEVELYMNNSLIDFQQADEMGNYRFLTPITYGSSQLDLKIYGPTGQIIERSNRIQVPFAFQPKGVFNYNINFGQLDNPVIGSTNQNLTAQGNGALGITSWLTAKAGIEYYQGLSDELPTFTSTLSSRILSNYILTLEAASKSYYRGVFSSIFPNSASINIDYTDYTSDFSIYNPSNDDKRLIASIFYPFNIFGGSFNLRASTFSRIRETTNSTTIRVDANSRIGKINLRVGYSDRFTGTVDLLNPTNTSFTESSATFNISRNRNLPPYIRGVFLRTQMRYQPTLNEFESAEFLISRNVLQKGRFQLSVGRNFRGDYNTIRFSLVVDFNKLRTNTTFNDIRGNSSFTQNVRGSVGYDSNYNNFLFTSRNQVGRSGTAIQLYVDNDGDGKFNKSEDRPIEANAVRIQRSGAHSIQKNGILYFTQMQPYFYYNMQMNKSALNNPMLVPEFEQFGLITDPNRFKKVEIPFYMSGVIEGLVERQGANERKSGIGGLKILLTQTNGDYSKELRTFSDGSFYDYEVPPGKYELEVDPAQLEILKRKSSPEKIEFQVEARPEGDFVEGLRLLLVPSDYIKPSEPITENLGVAKTENQGGGISLEYNITVDSLRLNQCRYGIQLGAYSTDSAAKRIVKSYSNQGDSYVVYNMPTRLYAVRTGPYQAMSQAVNAALDLSDTYPDATVLNQCYESIAPNFSPGAVRYDLQFAAFSNPNRAENYADNLRNTYGLKVHKVKDENSYLYKVRMGPFSSRTEAIVKLREILRTTSITDIFVSKQQLPSSMINVEFEFILQMGEFETTRQAMLYAIRIEEEFGFRSKILVDEMQRIILVAEDVFEDWNEINNLKNKIEANSAFRPPIIQLIEQKTNGR